VSMGLVSESGVCMVHSECVTGKKVGTSTRASALEMF